MARLASLTAFLTLLLADLALAQAGGGSSSFGGSGGGGGSSSGFGGGSSGSGSGSGDADPLTVAIFFAVFGAIFVFILVKSLLYHRKVKARHARVRTASAEAAEDDAYFAADELEKQASELFCDAQAAWDQRDRDRLAQLVGEDLLVEWNRRLDDFDRKGWRNRVRLHNAPAVRYVGLVNREDDTEDRAVVRLTATMDSYVLDRGGNKIRKKDSKTDAVSICEYWTLARRGERWIVSSIEQREEGDHHLDAEIVASPWSDSRLADEALTEVAAADALPEGFTTADLATVDFEGDAREHALDLSLADARFAPDVLEAAARRAVAAWAEAVDGSDSALEQVARPEAVRELLYGGDASERTRLVVRGPRVRRIAISAVQVDSAPATMAIEVEVGGRRYTEDRDTAAVLSGDKDSATVFTERWTLALEGPETAPWRLVQAGAAEPAAGGRKD